MNITPFLMQYLLHFAQKSLHKLMTKQNASWPKSTICTHKLAKRWNGVPNVESLAAQSFQEMGMETNGVNVGRWSG
ncbi:hypothetical protein J9978_06435 [Chromobacterium violaceum]|uniref:hypothetical protein n=1 Tax=Chromobacterium violaceum TaxID=536 RepID=UPI001B31D7D7|nr:hypothetical protein [Chromobacterium violaceum]MBP4049136.1 hypothetical protein [Chromobacterium violaceum]